MMRQIVCYMIIIMIIGCTGAAEDYYIGGKYAFSDNQIIQAKKKNGVLVTKTVVDYVVHTYNYDNEEKFIIAYQIPYNAYEVSSTNAYWIIDVEHERVYGPMSLKDFRKKKEQLHVNLDFKKNIGSSMWCSGRLQQK